MQFRLVRRVFALVVLLAAITVPTLSAQVLDGQWFKVNFMAKGHTEDADGHVATLNFTRPIYLGFTATDTHSYDISFWNQTDSGWTNSYNSSEDTVGAHDNFISDFYVELHGPGTNFLKSYVTAFVTVRTNQSGAVTGGMMTAGGEVYSASVSDKTFYGGCSLKGTIVPASKLPFTP